MDHTDTTGETTEPPRRTSKAIEMCAVWLQWCLRIGWPKSALNDLEKLWWQYHDERGDLIQ